jgi:hypothetical protein
MKKLQGENDIEATLQRLDRLTLDESRATAAQTLEVVYGLVRQRKVVMDGEKIFFLSLLCSLLGVHTQTEMNRHLTSRVL